MLRARFPLYRTLLIEEVECNTFYLFPLYCILPIALDAQREHRGIAE